jgi:hypothetical protein
LWRALWIALTLVSVPAHAVAQDRGRIEVAGGYLFMEDYDSNMTFPRGWFGSLAVDVAGPFAAVAEVNGSYKSMFVPESFSGLDVEASSSSHTFMGGPRLTWQTSRVNPFAQMLFGLSRLASSVDWTEGTATVAQNDFAMAPGGGVDLRLSERGAIRVGASIRFIRAENFAPGSGHYTFKEFQFITGVVFR